MFGKRLKELREERNMTQQQLADVLQVGRPTIAGYETKGTEPDFGKIRFLAEYFDVSIDYLLGGSDTRVRDSTPLTNEAGNRILQRALQGTGLLDQDGRFTEEGRTIVSEFIANNVDMLKQLLGKDR